MVEKNEVVRLRDVVSKHDKNDIVFIHKYNVNGYFKYIVGELSDTMLDSELTLIREHFGGVEYNYNSVAYLIK